MTAQRDLYEVLGVPKTADEGAIKSAYRKKALEHHPDRNKGDDAAAEKFKEAAEAYAVLSDPAKRQRYDQFGHAGVQGGQGGVHFENLEDIFSQFGDIFGGHGGGLFENLFGFGRGQRSQSRGRSLRIAVPVNLDEVLHGTERTVSLRRNENCDSCGGDGAAKGTSRTPCPYCQGRGEVQKQQGFFAVRATCPQCRGQGSVVQKPCESCHGEGLVQKEREISLEIPAGIEDGAQIRRRGDGEPEQGGGPAGDLYCEVHCQPHERFHRDGRDLYCELPFSYTQLALGDKVPVATLDGEVRMTIPGGTPTGKLFRLRGKGLPRLHGGSRGDLLVRVVVEVPENLDRKEKAHLKKLAEIEKERRAAREER